MLLISHVSLLLIPRMAQPPTIESIRDSAAIIGASTAALKIDLVEGSIQKTPISLFWEANETLGSLYWYTPSPACSIDSTVLLRCPAGQREQIFGQALLVESLTDVFVGKQTVAMAHETMAEYHEDRCFSLKSVITELNAVFEDASQCSSWLAGTLRVWLLHELVMSFNPLPTDFH